MESIKNYWTDLPKQITIMHPGPINRGVELDSDVADSDQSVILQQVENGVAVEWPYYTFYLIVQISVIIFAFKKDI